MVPEVVTYCALLLFWIATGYWPSYEYEPEVPVPVPDLQLTHIFHRNAVDQVHGRYDVSRAERVTAMEGMRKSNVRTKWSRVPRFIPASDSMEVIEHDWRRAINRLSTIRSNPQNWRVDRAVVPDIEDKDTVVTLAKIAANAYVPTPYEGDWSNVSSMGWSIGDDQEGGFGWMDDGVRGYVFASEDQKTVVISYKGTSGAGLNDGGPTAPNDKLNDNLLFSCCCARISYVWSTVCDCYLGGPGSRCDQQCLERELYREDRYYRAALDVYANATALYPDAKDIWVVGHSLGGVLSSLVGRTFGLPAISYESPGEALAVKRLHLPAPPGIPLWDEHVWHIGHTADPIFMGTCTGSGSTCWLSGYAMETKCHSGQVCIYDVVKDKGWYASVANHRIHVVIDDVLEDYDEVAKCVLPAPCNDCEQWDFEDPLAIEPSSSTALTSKPTSTTTKTTSTTTSIQEPSSSCVDRLWYGKCRSWVTITPLVTPTAYYGTS